MNVFTKLLFWLDDRIMDHQNRRLKSDTSRFGKNFIEESLEYVDNMDGHDFEYWCADLISACGFDNVEVTPSSNDNGVDIIAYKNNRKCAIQCKRFSKSVGNTPVQEVFTGKSVYGCSVAIVMTNSYFTDGAIRAADATGVLLWDRETLKDLLQCMKNGETYDFNLDPTIIHRIRIEWNG